MGQVRLTLANKPGVYVTNLREVRAYLKQIHPNLLPVLRNELQGAVEVSILPQILRKIPTGPDRGGHARQTVRATGAGQTVYIQAGGRRHAYLPWLEFGGVLGPVGKRRNTQVRPFLKDGRWLYPTVKQNRQKLAQAAGEAVQKVINKL